MAKRIVPTKLRASKVARQLPSRPRTLTVWGSPFGGRSEKIADLSRTTNEVLRDNYGTAGHQFVQYLVQNRAANQGQWRERYDQLVSKYENKAVKNHFARRQAPNFAAIVLAAELAHTALSLPWRLCNPIDLLWEELTRGVGGADQAAEALRVAMDWAASSQARFCGRSEEGKPPAGWLGRWERGTNARWPWIGFLRAPLTTYLDSKGFVGETMIQLWYDRGWLHTAQNDKQKRRTFRALIEKEPCWLIAVTREAVEKVGSDSHS